MVSIRCQFSWLFLTLYHRLTNTRSLFIRPLGGLHRIRTPTAISYSVTIAQNSSKRPDFIGRITVEYLDQMTVNLVNSPVDLGSAEANSQDSWNPTRYHSHHPRIHHHSNYHSISTSAPTVFGWGHPAQILRRDQLVRHWPTVRRAMVVASLWGRKLERMATWRWATARGCSSGLVQAAWASEKGPAVALQLVEAFLYFALICTGLPSSGNLSHISPHPWAAISEPRTFAGWKSPELLCHVRDPFLYLRW